MKRVGQVVVFRFPQTDFVRGKLRPALILGKLPSKYDDWLVCIISTQLTQQIEGFDEIIREGDADFAGSGLKSASVIRLGRLAVVEGKTLIGATGEIDAGRLERLKSNLATWLIKKEEEKEKGEQVTKAEQTQYNKEFGHPTMAEPEHLSKLQEGVDAWNAWRNEFSQIIPDLSGADLEGMNLARINLSAVFLAAANLRGANLKHANMIGAEMANANFEHADLSFALLRFADISHANFANANLFQANLTEADARGANFADANLNMAVLAKAYLANANLARANLASAALVDADLSNVILDGANLEAAILPDGTMNE